MSRFETPLSEICYNIGVLYELSLSTNIALSESVNNLNVTVSNLIAAESRVNDLVMAQEKINHKYSILQNVCAV
jgi:hypothetical protein